MVEALLIGDVVPNLVRSDWLHAELCDGLIAVVDASQFESVLARMATDALASGSPQNNPRVPPEKEIIELCRATY